MTTKKTDPFNASHVLRESKMLYQFHFKVIFTLGFILSLVKQVLGHVISQNIEIIEQHVAIKNAGMISLALLGAFVVSIIITGTIQLFVANSYRVEKWPLSHCFKTLLTRILGFFVVCFITTFIVWAGLALYILPGILLLALFFVAQPVVLFETANPFHAIRRAVRLGKQQFFGLMVLAATSIVLMMLPNLVINYFIDNAVRTTSYGIDQVVAIFINALLIPFVAILPVVAYRECSHREPKKDLTQAK